MHPSWALISLNGFKAHFALTATFPGGKLPLQAVVLATKV
jgi:hypothetical protein